MDNTVRKNLIYFIWWNPCSEMLFFNLRLMDEYIHLFDGLRIIKIAGVGALNESVYIDYPWLKKAEFVENDIRFNEARHFMDSLSRVPRDDNSITFYGHAKGVSRHVNNPLKYWVEMLYRGNLGIEPDLSEKLFSGCFGILRLLQGPVSVPWHYSGSFYWFRTKEVLSRFDESKDSIPQIIWNRWFTENFPGWIAKEKEAEFKLHVEKENLPNCYSDHFWRVNRTLLGYLKQ